MTDKELQDAQRSLAKQHAALREQRGLIARETDKRVVVLNAKKKVAGMSDAEKDALLQEIKPVSIESEEDVKGVS